DSTQQHQSIKARTPAQCHIHLSRSKRLPRIDDRLLKSETLTLVNGDGPGEAQRKLKKSAESFLLEFLRTLVYRVTNIQPLFWLHFDLSSIFPADDSY